MSSLAFVIFWASYMMVVFSLIMWSARHPLMIGVLVLMSYMFGSALISFNVSFVIGIFLFLTGVSGMMVAFLYVVALCPNPVFKELAVSLSYSYYIFMWFMVSLVVPGGVIYAEAKSNFGLEVGSLGEAGEWYRDLCMAGGLSNLMPLLGFVLFLCMVSVVSLCVQQKQCLGGHNMNIAV
uniref:NADH dehydrogenase subunit 6 n=1 Tax=Donax variegatus TaxID=1920007 RepID=A0A250E5V4_9BIVA|nr:NADH dehydrogenase subunit 6 [Donax variegatus]ATA66406.1 NADH dehydrogenase subunit 6 [Donax variegatus]